MNAKPHKALPLFFRALVPPALLFAYVAFLRSAPVRRSAFAFYILGVVMAGVWVFECIAAVVDWNARRRAEPVVEGLLGGLTRDTAGTVVAAAILASAVPPAFRILRATNMTFATGWLLPVALQLGVSFVIGQRVCARTHSRGLAMKAGAGIAVVTGIIGNFTGLTTDAGIAMLKLDWIPLYVGTLAEQTIWALINVAVARMGASLVPRKSA